jgi:hypothetical protein
MGFNSAFKGLMSHNGMASDKVIKFSQNQQHRRWGGKTRYNITTPSVFWLGVCVCVCVCLYNRGWASAGISERRHLEDDCRWRIILKRILNNEDGCEVKG